METERLFFSGNKKSGTVFLYFDNFNSLFIPDNIAIYVSLIIIYDNLMKYITVTVHLLQ